MSDQTIPKKRVRHVKEKIQEKVLSQDWLSLWEHVGELNRGSVLIGGILILVLAIAIGFVGSWQVAKAKQYYTVRFIAKYLEDVRPGTKIRYQGGPVIGTVEAVISGINHHEIIGKIKKDFRIPRKNVIISLKSRGSFGGKYINIDMHETAIASDTLKDGDSIEIPSVTNSSIILGKFFNLIKSEQKGALSPLEKNLLQIKKMTYQLSHSPSLQPWNTRKAIRSVTEAAHRYFAALEQIGSQSYHAIATVHDEISETIKSSSYVLPHLRQQLIALSKNLNYNDSLPYDWKRKLIHEDTQYYELLEYSKYLLEKMQKFKNNPTKIFF